MAGLLIPVIPKFESVHMYVILIEKESRACYTLAND